MTFDQFNLSASLQRSIQEMGFKNPSPIQLAALPILLGEATDFIGLAATGTGKTAAFSLPMLEKIDPSKLGVQAVVLCPTRELAAQVAEQINLLGLFKGIKAAAVYGGASFGDQVYKLKQGASVVVGTPGRVIDHLSRGTLNLEAVSVLILDEADEMISMGFKDELEEILKSIPREKANTWLFSATMSREVRRVADTYLSQAKTVQINRSEMLSSTVEQFYYVTQESNKPEILCKLIDSADDFYGVIFCQTKSLVSDLTGYLAARGYKVDCLHGDKNQMDRERTMRAFRERRVQMIVCTDVAARGLDVKDVTHVINYSIPRELDNYVHRIGRTARSGKAGVAMSLVTPANRRLVERIEVMTKSKMTQGKIPTSKEVGVKKVSALLSKFKNQNKFTRVEELLDADWKNSVEVMSKEEIAARFVAILMPDLLEEPQKNNFSTPRETRESRHSQSSDRREKSRHGRGPRNRDESGSIRARREFETPRFHERELRAREQNRNRDRNRFQDTSGRMKQRRDYGAALKPKLGKHKSRKEIRGSQASAK